MSNCSQCKRKQKITKNPDARCIIHGLRVLLSRYEKKQLALSKLELRELRRLK